MSAKTRAAAVGGHSKRQSGGDPPLSVYQFILKSGGADPKPGVYYSTHIAAFLRSLSSFAFDTLSEIRDDEQLTGMTFAD